jgi:hypothetical protein
MSVIKSRSFQKPLISNAIQKKSIEKEPHPIAKTCANVSTKLNTRLFAQ